MLTLVALPVKVHEDCTNVKAAQEQIKWSDIRDLQTAAEVCDKLGGSNCNKVYYWTSTSASRGTILRADNNSLQVFVEEAENGIVSGRGLVLWHDLIKSASTPPSRPQEITEFDVFERKAARIVSNDIPSTTIQYVSPKTFTEGKIENDQKVLPLRVQGDKKELDFRFLNRDQKSPIAQQLSNVVQNKNIAALVAVSGSGKTSSIFELAREKFNLYFQVPEMLLGSPDLKRVINAITDRTTGTEVRKSFSVLICSRLYYLLSLSSVTAEQWLLMQLPVAENVNLHLKFSHIYTLLMQCSEVIADEIFQRAKENFGDVFVALDEAQLIAEKAPSPSIKSTPIKAGEVPHDRCLLSEFVQVCPLPLVVSGTSLRLSDISAVTSAMAKIEDHTPQLQTIYDVKYFTEGDVRSFLENHLLPTTNNNTFPRNVTEAMCGRARCVVSFVQHSLISVKRGTSVDDISSTLWNQYYNFIVNGTHIPGSCLENPDRSYANHFRKHIKYFRSLNEDTLLKTELGTLLTHTVLAVGDGLDMKEADLDLVSHGICFLKTPTGNEEKLAYRCAEPMVLDAMLHVLGVEALTKNICTILSQTKSLLGKADPSKGILLQTLTAAQLIVNSSPEIPLRDLLKQWVGEDKVDEVKGKVDWLQKTLVKSFNCKKMMKDANGYDVAEFLLKPDADYLLTLVNAARAEYLCQLGGLLVLVGCKMYQNDNKEAFRDNRQSTNLSQIYHTKKGTVNQNYQKHYDVVKEKYQNYVGPNGTLRRWKLKHAKD